MVGRTLKVLLIGTLLLASTAVGFAQHPRYRFSVIAAGLDRPVGITVEGSETVYFTLVPTPGVGGGANGVAKLDLETGAITMLHVGEPEPTPTATSTETPEPTPTLTPEPRPFIVLPYALRFNIG